MILHIYFYFRYINFNFPFYDVLKTEINLKKNIALLEFNILRVQVTVYSIMIFFNLKNSDNRKFNVCNLRRTAYVRKYV